MMFRRLYGSVQETPLQLDGAGGALHAMLYSADTAKAAVVIAAPDGEERVWAERSLVTTARGLAQAGCAVMRFDGRGQGESEGEYQRAGVRDRIDDLRLAYQALQKRSGRMPIVLGVRLGAAIAAAMAADGGSVASLVLWEPVMDPRAYVSQLLRVNVSMQMVVHGKVLIERDELLTRARAGEPVNVNGFSLAGSFIDELFAMDVPSSVATSSVPTHIMANGAVHPGLAEVPHVTFDEVACPPFWKEPKIHVTGAPTFLAPTLARLGLSAGGSAR